MDRVDIYDVGTVNPYELVRVQLPFHSSDTRSDRIMIGSTMQKCICAFCFDPIDLISVQEEETFIRTNKNSSIYSHGSIMIPGSLTVLKDLDFRAFSFAHQRMTCRFFPV